MKCNKCGGLGWILSVDEMGNLQGRRCECFAKEMAEQRLKNSGISEIDLSKTWDDFETKYKTLEVAKTTAKQFVQNFEETEEQRCNSLLFSGASGRGKTMLGMIAANDLIKNHAVSVYYAPYRETITRIKQNITSEEGYRKDVERLKNARVLFIDDLFKGRITESDINIMYEIINDRYLAHRPMIISTELMPDKLFDVDEAIAGRIIEMCRVLVFPEAIPNYRLKKI